ncbi:Fic family protein [Gilliamella sp. ESL0250]|uniref:Fic family protein n=1 Tax=Gilliamella sp. ESL0250 TaxID=2705036 RepID=UPI00157FC697|nr:Fic family protein [Gilliamella sp. ESL0250]NUF49226.1 Fic family protein [Gilliamella sp. ESL0250]
MKLEKFKSGRHQQRYQYKSFEPNSINQEWSWDDPTINTLLEQANKSLGELNAFSLIVPDIDLFVRMHIVKEAQKSSKIEGTQTEMDEALMQKEQIQPEKRNDWQEVQNYIKAINIAINKLNNLPLSVRLLKEIHSLLLQGVRGEHKQPGDFRTTQNWIGGSNLSDAVFIPPHAENVNDLMGDLELFWYNENINVPHLIRIAISHYQFETIHPFLDGNGRIGRLLIPLYLIDNKMLTKPALYLSDFFERNRSSYYDALMRVRTSNDMIHWIKFFLNGIIETTKNGKKVFTSIFELDRQVKNKLTTLGRRTQQGNDALNVLYKNPIISAVELGSALNISNPTSNKLIRDLMKLDILREANDKQKGQLYVFSDYFKLFL